MTVVLDLRTLLPGTIYSYISTVKSLLVNPYVNVEMGVQQLFLFADIPFVHEALAEVFVRIFLKFILGMTFPCVLFIVFSL